MDSDDAQAKIDDKGDDVLRCVMSQRMFLEMQGSQSLRGLKFLRVALVNFFSVKCFLTAVLGLLQKKNS